MLDRDKMMAVVVSSELETVKRAMHLGFVFGLRKLGCSYSALKSMAERNDYWSDDHEKLWYGAGVLADPALVEWAMRMLDASNDFGTADEVNENPHPDDEITGEPHHVVINGDHGGCACGGHLVECTTWDDPEWFHKPTICGITRTLCNHVPRHTYNQPCASYESTGDR